jgi:2',3'-cyclic-nucleotide 2'-phosphodiesterase (5'-nucleotidase family)
MNAMATQATEEGKDVVKLHAGDALTGTLYYTFLLAQNPMLLH